MRIYDYLEGILGALGEGEDNGVPTPAWRLEEYLRDIYGAVKSGVYPSDEQVTTAIDGWLDDHPEATTTVEDGSITNAKLATSFVTPGTAPAYSSSATYAVGDYVFYNGALYRCTTAITTAESWTAAHWTAVVLGNDVSRLDESINNDVAENIEQISDTDMGMVALTPVLRESLGMRKTGGYYSTADFDIDEYFVSGLQKVYISASKDSEAFAVWQFQTGNQRPIGSDNAYRVGETHARQAEGLYNVPSTATRLMVCRSTSNTGNKVYAVQSKGELANDLAESIVYADYDLSELSPSVTLADYCFVINGYQIFSGFSIEKYEVTAGDFLYVKATLDSSVSMQFQSAAGVYADNRYLVGNQYVKGVNGIIKVPSGATWLLVSKSTDNTVDKVYKISGDIIKNIIANKVDKVSGKGLSTNDFTDHYKETIDNLDGDLASVIAQYVADHPGTFDGASMLQLTNVTLTVGASGQYQTIGAALAAASKLHAINGVTVTVKLLSGFEMAEQVVIDKDLSFVTITAEDASVTIDGSSITETNISVPVHANVDDPTKGYSAVGMKCAFAIVNGGKSPLFSCNFSVDMTGVSATVVGIGAYNGSEVTYLNGYGLKNATCNLYLIEGCKAQCAGADFGGAVGTGINVFRESHLEFGGGKCKGCGENGIYIDGNSTADLTGSNFSNTTETAIYIGVACLVSGNEVIANGCKKAINTYSGGKFSGRNCEFKNASSNTLLAQGGSEIVLLSSDLTGCAGKVAIIETESKIVTNYCNINNFASGESAYLVRKGMLIAEEIYGTGTSSAPAMRTVKVEHGFAIVSGSGVTVTPTANTIDATSGVLILMPTA